MRSLTATMVSRFLALLFHTASACVYFNATLLNDNGPADEGSQGQLTVDMWDDSNNNRIRESGDPQCTGESLDRVGKNHWRVPCKSGKDTILDVFLDRETNRFLKVVYRYLNEAASDRQDDDPEFIFTWEAGSVDGKHFKTRQFCDDVLYDLGLFRDGCDIEDARKFCG